MYFAQCFHSFSETIRARVRRCAYPEREQIYAKLDYKMLWHLSEKIALLLETCFLDEFGFTENRIKEIGRSRSQRARHVHSGAF
jgi:DNA primase catalytic subunit